MTKTQGLVTENWKEIFGFTRQSFFSRMLEAQTLNKKYLNHYYNHSVDTFKNLTGHKGTQTRELALSVRKMHCTKSNFSFLVQK